MTEVMVPVYMLNTLMPRNIQTTAKIRAETDEGVRSPYL